MKQLDPSTFFVTFTSIERLWDPFIKTLQTLHASKLNIPNKIEDLQFVHIVKLVRIDLVTCAKYYDHKTSCFCKLITKDHYLFCIYIYIYIYNLLFIISFSSLNSKIMGTNMTMDFYG